MPDTCQMPSQQRLDKCCRRKAVARLQKQFDEYGNFAWVAVPSTDAPEYCQIHAEDLAAHLRRVHAVIHGPQAGAQ